MTSLRIIALCSALGASALMPVTALAQQSSTKTVEEKEVIAGAKAGFDNPIVSKGFNPQPEPPAIVKKVEDPVAIKGFNPQPEPPAAAKIPGTRTFDNITLKRGTMAPADSEPLIGEDGKSGTQAVMPRDNPTIQDIKVGPVAKDSLTMPRVLGQTEPEMKELKAPEADAIVAPDM